MARPRKQGRRDLQNTNITIRQRGDDIHYGWIDPRSGKEKSLKAKNNRELAVKRANALNTILSEERDRLIIENLTKIGKTVSQWIPEYLKLLERRGLKENTLRSRKSLSNKWNLYIGNLSIDLVSPGHITEGLEAEFNAGRKRQAVAMRSAAIDMFREAAIRGWFPPDRQNPAEIARADKAPIKRSRLSVAQFKEILAANPEKDPWRTNIMLLAIVTGQAREDLSLAQFTRQEDWFRMAENYSDWIRHRNGPPPFFPYSYADENHYFATRQKTGAMIKIPLDLQLNTLELSIRDVLEQCRDNVKSRFIIHHTRKLTLSAPGDGVHKDTISRSFHSSVMKTNIDWGSKNRATFHEIRSLSERLYSAQGVNTQRLLGHSDPRTTAKYNDSRAMEWKEI